ncbi:MAG: PilZ domain-containing protein [Methylococcaceae bacterium]|nr:PilZ domain-containing protein [Methylococcaceae bacterium]
MPAPEPSASRLLFEPRRDLAVPIAVDVFRRDGEAALEYATNLSPGGVCLHARLRLTVGENVTVAFALPGDEGRIRARGRVTWREDDDPRAEARFLETGVRFEVVDETDRERITRFVRELERE